MAAKKTSKKTTKKATVRKKSAKKAVKKKATKKKAVKKKTAKKTVKKVAKKATKKKAAPKKKKVSSPTEKQRKEAAEAAARAMRDIIARARDHFRTAPHVSVFHVTDGRRLHDLNQLAEALENMQHHVFSHHVNEHKHDFASWVHETLQEQALAQRLRVAQRDPKVQQHVIYQHIVRRVW